MPVTAASEAQIVRLIDRARRGDELAFADLYGQFFDRVHKYLVIALGDPEDARDAAQQVFLKVFRALPRYEERGLPFRAWLFRITRNQALDQGVRDRERARPTDPHALSEYQDSQTRSESLSAGFGGPPLAELLRRLPETQRRVLGLRFAADLAPDEIADLTGSTPDAVRHIQKRALASLAKMLTAGAASRAA
jgi:RNA polymerase sigma-70 factor (ECF subfamily)